MGSVFNELKKQILKLEKAVNEYLNSTKAVSNPSLSYVEWATKLLEEGKEQTAIEKLETATQMAIKNPEACVNLALEYMKLGKKKEVVFLLNNAIKIDSQYARAYLAYGVYKASIKDYKTADYYYNIASKLDPRLPDVFINWAVSLVSQGKNNEAQEKFQKAQFYNPNNLMGLYLWAVLDIDMSDYQTARKKLSLVLSFQPTNPEALFSMAFAYYKEKNYSMAIEFAKNAMQYNDNNPQIYSLLADSYCCFGEYENALCIYKQGDQKDFNNENFYLSWGENSLQYKDYEKSIYAYETALKINPESIEAKRGLASNYIITKNYEYAKKLLLDIVDKKENNSDIYINLAKAENLLENYKNAIEYVNKAIKIDVNNTRLYYDLGILYEKNNEPVKAKESYIKMLEYDKEHYKTCYRYARLCINDDPKEALRKIRKAYNANKENYEYAKLYVKILIKNNMIQNAQDILNEILSKYEDKIELLYLKTEILLNINKYNEVINILYNLPEDKKFSEDFDYMLIQAYILRATATQDETHINEMNDFSYYLSQKYGKNYDFMVKLKSLEDKNK